MSLDPALGSALEAAAGAEALSQHAPIAVDDAHFEHTLRPRDGEALARCLALLSERGVGVVVRGGATRLDFGNPPRGAQLLLDTRGLAGIEAFEPADGVIRAGAGTPLSLLREKVATEGWELPLDPPGSDTTLGGVVASAAFGPRAQAYGTPRDNVLGLDVVLSSGERTRCGGRVVKNVTGYDLAKLYTGSCGALGVIEALWLRLRPRPEASAVLEATTQDVGAALLAALETARRETTRAAAVSIDADGSRTVIELAGDARAVEAETELCASSLGARASGAEALDQVRAVQASGDFLVRVTALAGALVDSVDALRNEGAALLVYPGLGILFARFEATRATADTFARCAAVARAAGGQARLERAPVAVKREGDVYGEAGDALPLERALKQRFDPAGVLNPGRSAGCL